MKIEICCSVIYRASKDVIYKTET